MFHIFHKYQNVNGEGFSSLNGLKTVGVIIESDESTRWNAQRVCFIRECTVCHKVQVSPIKGDLPTNWHTVIGYTGDREVTDSSGGFDRVIDKGTPIIR